MTLANVNLGDNVCIEPSVIIGKMPAKLPQATPLQIGDNSVVRSFTVIYLGSKIGSHFQSGHGAVIRENNILGNHVSIGSNTECAPGNVIGNNVRIHSNCFLENVTIEDDVFIGPHVMFTDDLYPPRSGEYLAGATVKKGAAIGANATILPGVVIGARAIVGAGSVVTRDVAAETIVAGNPAKIIKTIHDIAAVRATKCR